MRRARRDFFVDVSMLKSVMSILSKLVSRCVSIAPVLLSVPLASAQNVTPSGTSLPSADSPETAVPNPV
jgi:hypothetical protein